MKERYEPNEIEPRWQAAWAENRVFSRHRDGLPKRYVVEMLPYPSGALHMGHVRNYLIGDVLARFWRMRGFNVIHPMGWDALGLPAENAAIKDQRHPAERTAENVDSFKAEMQRLGFSYDWERELSTSDPAYYRWNQWFFLEFKKRGLVYKRHASVNWCTGCLTVIANEQVKEGVCERCDSAVVIQRRPEWAFRITNYSQRLLDNLDKLTGWQPEVVKKQRHWIGRSEGANLEFRVKDSDVVLEVFTTRPDTIYGCTYCVIAPDHPLLDRFVPGDRRDAVTAFAEDQARKAAQRGQDEDPPKEGIDTGAVALHPFTGEELPVWAANFVVADYGTGCVMSVPAHDQRDFEFAREFGLPIVPVIHPADGDRLPPGAEMTEAFTDLGVLADSGDFSGLPSAKAKKAVARAADDGGFGGLAVTYRQRDWGISRQRYWGTPIPIVYCDKCDPDGEGIDVPYEQLPVEIPDIDVQKVLTGRGEPPLAKVPEFVNATCPSCGGPARREVETMDTFVDSAWYFVRYLDPKNDELPFAKDIADEWMPLDLYIGGPEHSTMHLLYCRFWCMVMNEMGLLEHEEPVENMVCQGIVNGPDGRKMSKRWGNVIKPANIVDKYGADAARTFVAFAGPPDKDIMWSDEQVEGCNRFLLRLWRLAASHADSASVKFDGTFEGDALEIRRIAHKTLKVVTEDIERRSFNTAIARCMEMVNALTGLAKKVAAGSDAERAAMAEAVRLLAVMLSPIAPHIGEEISAIYGSETSLQEREWPAFDPALVVNDSVTYAVQVNGKLRGQIEVAADADKDAVRAVAEGNENVAGHLVGKTVRKFIFVPKRLVNFVVG